MKLHWNFNKLSNHVFCLDHSNYPLESHNLQYFPLDFGVHLEKVRNWIYLTHIIFMKLCTMLGT